MQLAMMELAGSGLKKDLYRGIYMEEKKLILDGKVYTEDVVNLMTKEEIKQLKRDIYNARMDIGIKKQKFIKDNNDKHLTKEYQERMIRYKIAAKKIHDAESWIGDIFKNKNNEEHVDREHWFFSFYFAANKMLPKFLLTKLENKATEKCGYSIEVNI